MIVPRNRLLVWVAVIVLPFAVLLAVETHAALVALAIMGCLFVVVAADAFLAFRSLAGVEAELPPVVRMSRDRTAKVEVRIRNGGQSARTIRVGLAMPVEIESDVEDVTVALPDRCEYSRLSWSCVPRHRGKFLLDTVHLEGVSPMGFWAGRKRVRAHCEMRAYPNLLTERNSLAALFLNRSAFGIHAQRQVGKGRDFEKLREYVPGDGFDEVHWKATARRGRPITKVFQIERTQEVYVIVDASRLSARKVVQRTNGFGASHSGNASISAPTVALERFITAALVLGLAAEQQGDHFGLLTFSDRIGTFLRASSGKAHYSACRDALYTLQPKIVSPDYDEICAFIRTRLRHRALLIFLTALDDPALSESFVRNMDLIRNQHLVLVNMLHPSGAVPVFANPEVTAMDDLYQHLGGHLQWQQLQELDKVLRRRGVNFSMLENERLCADVVSQYLGVKRRQLL